MQWNAKKAIGVIVLAAMVGSVLATVGLALLIGPRPMAEPLPEYGRVPAFALIDQHEQPVTREDLLGHVWVAEFIFTRCGAICPIMVQNMKVVRDELEARFPGADDVRFVSITVDPEHDTPEVLRAYAERQGADSENWLFLTAAQREPIWRLSEEGFKLGVSETPDDPFMPISHGSKFVLVDRDAQIRGYYTGTTTEGREELMVDLRQLLRE